MKKEVSIVLSREVSGYRLLAQLHYGLTDEQMVGVHVHHNPRRCDGGRNIPEHLYVYSYENHSYVHGDDLFVSMASQAGKMGGRSSVENNLGWYSEGYRQSEKYLEDKKRSAESGGRKAAEKEVGIFSKEHKNSREFLERVKRNGRESSGKIREKYGKKVMCVETGMIYPSSIEAGKQTNNKGNIRRSARSGGRLSAGGYHWVYLT